LDPRALSHAHAPPEWARALALALVLPRILQETCKVSTACSLGTDHRECCSSEPELVHLPLACVFVTCTALILSRRFPLSRLASRQSPPFLLTALDIPYPRRRYPLQGYRSPQRYLNAKAFCCSPPLPTTVSLLYIRLSFLLTTHSPPIRTCNITLLTIYLRSTDVPHSSSMTHESVAGMAPFASPDSCLPKFPILSDPLLSRVIHCNSLLIMVPPHIYKASLRSPERPGNGCPIFSLLSRVQFPCLINRRPSELPRGQLST
jgi:hypothetical protein